MVTATSGVIDQQGRPFTHAYEIYLEKATLFFDYMALPAVGDAAVPVTVLLDNGKVLRPKLSGGGPTDAFFAELSEVVRAVRSEHPFAPIGRRPGPRCRRRSARSRRSRSSRAER